MLSYNDPHVPQLPKMRHHQVADLIEPGADAEFLASQDCVLIATDHRPTTTTLSCGTANLVIDTRNATKNVREHREKIVKT